MYNITFKCKMSSIRRDDISVLNIQSWWVSKLPVTTNEQLLTIYILPEEALTTITVAASQKITDILSNKINRYKNIGVLISQNGCDYTVEINHMDVLFGESVTPLLKDIDIEDTSKRVISQHCTV